MTPYRQRHLDGEHTDGNQQAEANNDPPDNNQPDELPRRHAPLDALAYQRGITWDRDDLTVQQKRELLK